MSKKINVPVEISGTAKGYEAAAKRAEEATKKMASRVKSTSKGVVDSFKRIGATILLVFGVRQISAFGKELMALGGKAQGVETAFKRLGDADLLNDLRKATRGTVDDLTLMQKAVQAKNFKIPLEQLATYFEFATKRSIQTGESVDYLVESIITGIGRKSVLVMDNLGISAVELQKETKKTGDFAAAAGNIIRRELDSMGDVADTSTIKIAKLSTTWANFKLELGKKLVKSDFIISLLDSLDRLTKYLQGPYKTMSKEQLEIEKALIVEENKLIQAEGERLELINESYTGLKKFSKAAVDNRKDIVDLTKALYDNEAELIKIDKALVIAIEHENSFGTSVSNTIDDTEDATEAINKYKLVLDKLNKSYKEQFKEHPSEKTTPSTGGTGMGEFQRRLLRFGDIGGKIDIPELEDATRAVDELTNSFGQLGNAIGGVAGQWLSYVANVASTVPNLLTQIAALIAAKKAEAAVNTEVAVTGAAASVAAIPIVGPLLAIAAITSVLAALSSIPKLAGGGIVSGPTIAQVGEYPGASSNPEVIAPLSKLKDMLGGGGDRIEVFGKIHGRDIYLSSERYGQTLNDNT